MLCGSETVFLHVLHDMKSRIYGPHLLNASSTSQPSVFKTNSQNAS